MAFESRRWADRALPFVKGLLRPVVTLVFVVAFVGAAFYDLEVAAVIGSPMGIVLGFWFKDREPPS